MSQPTLFLSHSWDERSEWTFRFAQALRHASYDVFDPAEHVSEPDRIPEGLQACHGLIALIGPTESDCPSVYLEMGVATGRGIPVMPVVPAELTDTRLPFTKLKIRRGEPEETAKAVMQHYTQAVRTARMMAANSRSARPLASSVAEALSRPREDRRTATPVVSHRAGTETGPQRQRGEGAERKAHLTLHDVGAAFRAALSRRIGEQRYQLWFAHNTKLTWNADGLTLGVPNRFFQEWLQGTFSHALREAASEALGRPVAPKLVIDPELFQAARAESLERERQRLQKDEAALTQEIRAVDLQAASERALLIRKCDELQQLQKELKELLEMASRDVSARERPAPLLRLRSDDCA